MASIPVSPIGNALGNVTAQPGVVQVNLSAANGQIVTGGEFGLSTSMGDSNHDYLPYGDPAFQAVANQYPVDLLRHNWELNTMMDIIYPSRGSAPNFSYIDNFLKQQPNIKGFFNNSTGAQIVTLGFPSWLDVSNPSDQQLYAGLVKQIAQHFIAAGEPIQNYELVNEPDGHYNATDLANTFNQVAQALRQVDPTYKLGGLTESYAIPGDLQTFFNIAGPNIGFVSWHQYVTNGSDGKNSQQEVNDALGVAPTAQQVRQLMRTAKIPDSVPLFLGEYNVDGGVYSDPNNGNMVGAVAAAATTEAMITSNTNMTMGALWETLNDGTYAVFGAQGAYAAHPTAVTLSTLTQYMPGNLVSTTMPSNTPGLVGYTTTYNGGFSTALIDTNLSRGYTVDLSRNGLPTTGLKEIVISGASPNGTTITSPNLASLRVAAGSIVVLTNEAPHVGLYSGGTSTPPPPPPPSSAVLITPGDGSFTDAAGNMYMITTGLLAYENGRPIPGGSNTGAMELASSMEVANGTVYGQDATSHQWYTWDQSTWTPSAPPPAVSSSAPAAGLAPADAPASAGQASGSASSSGGDPAPVTQTWTGGSTDLASDPACWSAPNAPQPGDLLYMTGGTMNVANGALAGDTVYLQGNQGGSTDSCTFNLSGQVAMNLVGSSYPAGYGPATINLADNTQWSGGLSAGPYGGGMTVQGTGQFSNTSSYVDNAVTIDADVVGTGTINVFGSHALAKLEFMHGVSAGQSISVGGYASYGDCGMIVVDDPASFKGSVALGYGEALLKGVQADSYSMQNGVLSLYAGQSVVDSIPLAMATTPSGENGPANFGVCQTSAGVVIHADGSVGGSHAWAGGTALPAHV